VVRPAIALASPALEKLVDDALDGASVSAALAGVDAVIQSLGAGHGPHAILIGTTLFSRATRILIDAMRATGVRRLVTHCTNLGNTRPPRSCVSLGTARLHPSI
jgi:putative NADH-flavin reductase